MRDALGLRLARVTMESHKALHASWRVAGAPCGISRQALVDVPNTQSTHAAVRFGALRAPRITRARHRFDGKAHRGLGADSIAAGFA